MRLAAPLLKAMVRRTAPYALVRRGHGTKRRARRLEREGDTMAIYIIVAIVILGLSWWILVIAARRRGVVQMAVGVEIVKCGLGARLLGRYRESYDRETAAKLAAAVMNELFGDPPGNAEGASFLDSNKDLVLKEIRNLASDDEARDVLTQTMRVKCLVAFARGKRSAQDMHDPVRRLREWGLRVPGDEMPSPSTYLPIVRRFYEEIRPRETSE